MYTVTSCTQTSHTHAQVINTTYLNGMNNVQRVTNKHISNNVYMITSYQPYAVQMLATIQWPTPYE